MRTTLICAAALAAVGCWSLGADADRAAAADPPVNDMQIETPAVGDFFGNLPKDFVRPSDDAGKLLLREYGAVFVARGGATPPRKVVFMDEAEVRAFQEPLDRASMTIGGLRVELQSAALEALKAAIAEAAASGLAIGPRGADSSRRGYDQTVGLWASRVNPALAHWVAKGRISRRDADRIRSLTPFHQVPEVLSLEQQQIWFAKSLDKSIIYSVAPPGTSQHISMLALDVKEFENAKVREILSRHGWYQTVVSDLPHFTYLGVKKAELPSLGLKEVTNSGRTFWIPDI